MKKMITKVRCIKNITVFSFSTLTCVLVLCVFIMKLAEDITNKTELFVPGIVVLFISVIFVLIFSINRIMKYIKLLKKF